MIARWVPQLVFIAGAAEETGASRAVDLIRRAGGRVGVNAPATATFDSDRTGTGRADTLANKPNQVETRKPIAGKSMRALKALKRRTER